MVASGKTRTPRAPKVVLAITEEIIGDAVERDSSHCLWAEAVKAAYPDAKNVSVDLQTIRFSDLEKGLRYTYLTPRVAQVALVNFDQGMKPAPHQCVLRNGQVTRAGRRAPQKQLSEAQLKQRVEAGKKTHEMLAKTRLSSRNPTAMVVPDRIGGSPPPLSEFGKRREFGLRQLAR